MSLQVSTKPYVSATTQTIAMSSMFSMSPDASNPKYLYLAADDYNVYAGPASASSAGTLYGNGHSLALTVQDTTNLREAGILFTYNAQTGQYLNATYGNVTNVTFTSSGSLNDVTDIGFYATNSAFGTTSLPSDTYDLMVYSGYGYLGDHSFRGGATVLTSTATPFAPNAERNATPMIIASVAQTFVGQTCDDNGCWVLASTISALSGTSLPFAALNTDPGSAAGNGEWFVAYNGSTATNTDFQSTLRVGDIVSFVTTAGTGHVTTVVAGSGRGAMLLDNASFGYNRIGGTDDLIIQAQTPQNQEFDGVDAKNVTIYRLDTPIVISGAPTVALDQTNTLALASNFSTIDPAGTVLTRYEVRLGNAADILASNGFAVAMSPNGTYAVSSLAGVRLMAQSLDGSHSVSVRAYNGAYWGDWADSLVTPNAAGSISQPVTTPTTAIASLALSADTGASGTDFVTNQANQTISGTLTAALRSGESVLVSVDGGGTWTTATTTGAAFSTNATLQAGGGIMAKVTSAGGNGPVAVQSYVLDTTAPGAPTSIHISTDSGVSASDFVTNVAIQTITATLAAPLTVGDRLYGTTGAAVPMNLTAFVTGSTLTWAGAALKVGGGSISLTVVDLAGNVSAAGSQVYDLRTALPTAYSPSLALAADSGIIGDGITNVATPTFTGSTSTGVTVRLYDTDGTTLLGTGVSDSYGNYSIRPTTLSEGSHLLRVRAIDQAGNVGAASPSLALTIDRTAPNEPAKPTLDGIAAGLLGVSTTTARGTGEANGTVFVLDGLAKVATALVDGTGKWSAALELADGAHSISAYETDAAGNASGTSGTATVIVDTAPPVVIVPPVVTTPVVDPVIPTPVTGPVIIIPVTTLVMTPVATTTESTDPGHVQINPVATQPSPTVVPKTADDAGMTFRFFDLTHGTQFMTSSISEKNALIASRPDLAYEGAGMGTVQSDSNDENVASVYRFFSKVDGTHFFTTDAGEKDQTIATRSDLTFEGSNFNEHLFAQAGDVAVYRFFNGTNGSHFFTTSDAERADISMTRPDMVNEGIAFYAPKV